MGCNVTDTILMRTNIVAYKNKVRCVTILNMADESVLVWQHVYSDDEHEGKEDVGYRTMYLEYLTWLDHSDPLPVPLSAVSPKTPR